MGICKRCGKEYEKGHNASKYCDGCLSMGRDILNGKAFDYTKPQTCNHCDTTFYGNRKRKYCSDKCCNEAQLVKAKESRINKSVCVICGKEFKGRIGCKYCSGKCKSKRQRKRYENKPIKSVTYVCKYCGKTYHPKSNDRKTYCSRECAFLDRAKKCKICGKIIIGSYSDYCSDECKNKLIIRKCKECGKDFEGIKIAVYCSDECLKAKARRCNREQLKVKHDSEVKPTNCKECGVGFVSEYGNKHRSFCSYFCGRKYGRRIGKATRRARKKGQYYESIDPIEIFERDNWHCKICGVITLKRLRGTCDNRAPELDHIVPLSLGGPHSKSNVQCLCRKCNQSKGARLLVN
jgi:hypothetical protein